MDQGHDSDEPKAGESHFGTQISYILAGLAAVWLISTGLMSMKSFLSRRRHQMELQRDIERWQVAPGGIMTLQTLDSTSPAENYKFPQSSKSHPSLESRTLDSLELCAICLEIFENAETVRRLRCEHVYHQQCIDRWFQGRHFTCPLCKSIYVTQQGSATAS